MVDLQTVFCIIEKNKISRIFLFAIIFVPYCASKYPVIMLRFRSFPELRKAPTYAYRLPVSVRVEQISRDNAAIVQLHPESKRDRERQADWGSSSEVCCMGPLIKSLHCASTPLASPPVDDYKKRRSNTVYTRVRTFAVLPHVARRPFRYLYR